MTFVRAAAPSKMITAYASGVSDPKSLMRSPDASRTSILSSPMGAMRASKRAGASDAVGISSGGALAILYHSISSGHPAFGENQRVRAVRASTSSAGRRFFVIQVRTRFWMTIAFCSALLSVLIGCSIALPTALAGALVACAAAEMAEDPAWPNALAACPIALAADPTAPVSLSGV